MLAAVQRKINGTTTTGAPCIVYWTGRKGLSVRVKAWCGEIYDASDGVIQIPEGSIVCADCERAIKAGRPNL